MLNSVTRFKLVNKHNRENTNLRKYSVNIVKAANKTVQKIRYLLERDSSRFFRKNLLEMA